MKISSTSVLDSKTEYTVEFECVSTFVVHFQETSGLTDRQVIQKAIERANDIFSEGASLTVERSNPEGYYALSALGIERSSGQILGRPPKNKALLKVIK